MPRMPGDVLTLSREQTIQHGLQALQQIGADHVCRACISNGGSCCTGCQHLAYGVGCQRRNVSCTAWLCGYLKYILHEADMLNEWRLFWEQVPGQDFRQDFTPSEIEVERLMELPDLQLLSEAFGRDLNEIAKKKLAYGYILSLREKLNGYVEEMYEPFTNAKQREKLAKSLQRLSRQFPHFQEQLRAYRARRAVADQR